jgi:hypothetical protein
VEDRRRRREGVCQGGDGTRRWKLDSSGSGSGSGSGKRKLAVLVWSRGRVLTRMELGKFGANSLSLQNGHTTPATHQPAPTLQME